jgi:tetratricopeptide (TPR) repeat protein
METALNHQHYIDNAFLELNRNAFDAVETQCRHALLLDNRNPEALHLLGVAARRLGRPGEAIALIREAVRLAPERPEYANNLVALLNAAGYPAEAVAVGAEALCNHPDFAYLHLNLGIAYHAQEREEEAVVAFQRAAELVPLMVQAHFGLGCALEALDRAPEALTALRCTLDLAPEHAEAQNLLGRILTSQGLHAEACEAFRLAVVAAPDYAVAYNNLGSSLMKLERPQDALAALLKSLELAPESAQAHHNISVVFQEMAKIDSAIAHSRTAVALAPDNVDAHWCLSLQLLQAQLWADGWLEYEWRWKLPHHRRADGPPLWSGQPLAQDVLLIRAEQGQGDTLQFLRYVPRIRDICPHLILAIPKSLMRLTADSFQDVSVVEADDSPPLARFQISLMSLPWILGCRSDDDIPREIPYLKPRPDLVEGWKARWVRDPAPKRRIGIAWRGSATYKRDHIRSMAIEIIEPLLDIAGVKFYALHPDIKDSERPIISALGIQELSDGIGDFADTAALMETLDLVISVDTSVAHLAGALNRDVWIMLPFSCDWRWGTERPDSIWYPRLRLFRQGAPGDWSGVIAVLRHALWEWMGNAN